MRDRDDDGDLRLLDRARALVVAARAPWLTDPAGMALSRNKPLVASRDRDLPDDYPFAFATRPAVLRFLGEVRSPGTSSVPWPIPEAMELHAQISALKNELVLPAQYADMAVGPAERRRPP